MSDRSTPERTRARERGERPGRDAPDGSGGTPRERARYLLGVTAARLARVASVTAVPLATLALLAAVEALVAPAATVAVGSLPATRALAGVVALELLRRLCALNAGGDGR
ncbi:hypothetical protein BRC94_12565 [Halobacteriales archaeon QS_5_70_17]|nr:MAG: hypothetical protein BRC94_12565 [Halobacteriales archaeon QS_5_70_17]